MNMMTSEFPSDPTTLSIYRHEAAEMYMYTLCMYVDSQHSVGVERPVGAERTHAFFALIAANECSESCKMNGKAAAA